MLYTLCECVLECASKVRICEDDVALLQLLRNELGEQVRVAVRSSDLCNLQEKQ